ncbi:MAG: response regulator [Magnetococcales bacterium]|nr:response regulator [Magnetococcales bacterium]
MKNKLPQFQEPSLTTMEAGRRLGVSQGTILNWIKQKTLPSWSTVGGHRRIPVESVDIILKQRHEELQESSEHKTVSLLLVEDDSVLMAFYESMVKAWHLQVDLVTASNGFDALIQIGKTVPDIIITDLVMPKIDGIEMVKAIRGNPELNGTSIIAVTMLDASEIAQRGGLPIDVQVFQKPPPAKRLRAIISEKVKKLYPEGRRL